MLKVVLYFVYGTLMLVLAVDSLRTNETRTASLVVATFANAAAITGFVYLGIEIEKRKKNKPNCEPVEFENLKPGTYVVIENPHIPIHLLRHLFQYFISVEYLSGSANRCPITINISDAAKYKIQVAMNKIIEKIETGEGFVVKNDHSITKLGT